MAVEWGDVAGLTGAVTGIIGLGLSFASLGKAKQANQTAAEGLTISHKANEIADAANELSRHANQESGKSNDLAHEANRIAVAANELAQEANNLFHHQERRGVESHDVHWDGEWISPGIYHLRNDGTHAAYEVRVTVTVDEEQVRAESARVDGGGHLTLDFPQARRQYVLERQDSEEERSSSYAFPSLVIPALPSLNFHSIEERAYWKTELGTPKEHVISHNLASLGEFD
jgi:hypothetical protein